MATQGTVGIDPEAGSSSSRDRGPSSIDPDAASQSPDVPSDKDSEEEGDEDSGGSGALLAVAGLAAAIGGVWLASKKGLL